MFQQCRTLLRAKNCHFTMIWFHSGWRVNIPTIKVRPMLKELTHAVRPRLWRNSSSHSTLRTPRAICEPMTRMCTKKEESTTIHAHPPSMCGWARRVFLSLGSSSKSYPISSWLVYIFQDFLKYIRHIILLNINTKISSPSLDGSTSPSQPKQPRRAWQINLCHCADLGTLLRFSQDQVLL